ncbi:MAG: hypothetical protein WC756_12005 [Taibaiella sp.]|jgi:hypothetical protein
MNTFQVLCNPLVGYIAAAALGLLIVDISMLFEIKKLKINRPGMSESFQRRVIHISKNIDEALRTSNAALLDNCEHRVKKDSEFSLIEARTIRLMLLNDITVARTAIKKFAPDHLAFLLN